MKERKVKTRSQPSFQPIREEYPVRATWSENGIMLHFDSPSTSVQIRFARPSQLRALAIMALRVADAVESGFSPRPDSQADCRFDHKGKR